jgi:SRSO17 transposase
MSDVVTIEDLRSWVVELDELLARVASRFGRVEPRRQARAYVRGLLAPVERKNGWQLAEAAGDTTPDRMQRLLGHARWDVRGVREDLRAYVVENLGHRDGVLIVDETGFVKKGTASAGVQRQYSGTAGRIENCQVGVFMAYASPFGRALIDADHQRCRQAAIPADVEFATKQQLAQAMLARAVTAGVPVSWVSADEVYGQDYKFRSFLERHRLGYVVAVPCSQSVGLGPAGNLRADTLAAQAPEQAWKRRSAGRGAKGPRLYDWALATVPWDTQPGFDRWLLVRRSLTPDAKGELELAYYLCHGPADTTLGQLIRIAGTRWAIEECFQTAKNEVGLDHYQVRRYDAWHRHITLAMLAAAYLTVTAARTPKAATTSSHSHPPRSGISWHT